MEVSTTMLMLVASLLLLPSLLFLFHEETHAVEISLGVSLVLIAVYLAPLSFHSGRTGSGFLQQAKASRRWEKPKQFYCWF